MPDEEWIRKLEDGRRVKFIYQELPEDGAFITAHLEGNEVVYSVVLTKARNRLVVRMLRTGKEGDAGKMALARRRNMGQQGASCWDPVLDASQKHDERQPFMGATEGPDSIERSAERLEWELTRWPEGAEL